MIALIQIQCAENIYHKKYKNVHIGHSGGTFICQLAKLNGERVTGSNCDLNGELPWVMKNKNCEDELIEATSIKETFLAMERGFLDGEFCPKVFNYMTFLRNPLSVLNSYLFTFGHVDDAIEMLRNGSRVKSFGSYYTGFQPEVNTTYYDGKGGYGIIRLDNIYVRFFSGSTARFLAPLNTITMDDYLSALDHLNQLQLVLTDVRCSSFPERCNELLDYKLHWKHGVDSLPNSTNLHNKKSEKLNLTMTHFFERQIKYDFMLYEQANILFDKQYEEMKFALSNSSVVEVLSSSSVKHRHHLRL